MLNVCFTFDYELFFGENFGTDDEVLFSPTEKLIEMLHEEGVSATFFADTCSVIQNKKFGRDSYVDKFTKQLQKMLLLGQDVQLHIHSHWLNSDFNNKWIFSKNGYRVQDFGFTPTSSPNVQSIVKDGIDFLNSSLRSVNPDYKCMVYRAGGFTIQPHKQLVEVLYNNGIRVDSSVAPMLFSEGTNSYDFRNKLANGNWQIGVDSEWYENSRSQISLFEVPVATENKNALTFLCMRLFKPSSIKMNLGIKKGTYISSGIIKEKNSKINTLLSYISSYNALSMDAYNYNFLYKQLNRYCKKHGCKDNDCTIALIGHPKLVNEIYIENLRNLIGLLKRCKNDIRISSILQQYGTKKE